MKSTINHGDKKYITRTGQTYDKKVIRRSAGVVCNLLLVCRHCGLVKAMRNCPSECTGEVCNRKRDATTHEYLNHRLFIANYSENSNFVNFQSEQNENSFVLQYTTVSLPLKKRKWTCQLHDCRIIDFFRYTLLFNSHRIHKRSKIHKKYPLRIFYNLKILVLQNAIKRTNILKIHKFPLQIISKCYETVRISRQTNAKTVTPMQKRNVSGEDALWGEAGHVLWRRQKCVCTCGAEASLHRSARKCKLYEHSRFASNFQK